jgi:ZIP family zinc transporter
MVYLLATGAFLATVFGGVVAVRVGDKLHLVLGVAAGVMLGVVGFDLLPEALGESQQAVFGVPAVMLALIGGFFCVHALERSLAIHRGHEGEFGGHHHGGHTHGIHAHDDHAGGGRGHGAESVGVLAGGGLVLHSVLDGVGIGLGFQAGRSVGLAVAIAVIAHDFADGFNTFTITTLYGNARRRALVMLGLDAIAPVLGTVIGSSFSVPGDVIGIYLGYFAGFLLYLATSDILPEAHARHASRMTLACTLAGAGFMWLVVGLSG